AEFDSGCPGREPGAFKPGRGGLVGVKRIHRDDAARTGL
ncbi:MAG: hypothetical protein, partial [Olavius algarvensis Gamma 3 endosymbiont]